MSKVVFRNTSTFFKVAVFVALGLKKSPLNRIILLITNQFSYLRSAQVYYRKKIYNLALKRNLTIYGGLNIEASDLVDSSIVLLSTNTDRI
jgi:hypothetical protein